MIIIRAMNSEGEITVIVRQQRHKWEGKRGRPNDRVVELFGRILVEDLGACVVDVVEVRPTGAPIRCALEQRLPLDVPDVHAVQEQYVGVGAGGINL